MASGSKLLKATKPDTFQGRKTCRLNAKAAKVSLDGSRRCVGFAGYGGVEAFTLPWLAAV